MRIAGIRKSYPQAALDTMLCLTSFPDGRYELLKNKTTDYIVSEAIFLPGLKTVIPERAQWNGGILQGQRRSIFIFTDGSKLGVGTGAGVFCRELSFEHHFRLTDDCRVLQAEIFAILKTIETIACPSTLDLGSHMIFVDSQGFLREIASVWCGSFANARSR